MLCCATAAAVAVEVEVVEDLIHCSSAVVRWAQKNENFGLYFAPCGALPKQESE